MISNQIPPFPPEAASTATKWSSASAPAAWARSTGRAIRFSSASSSSRSFRRRAQFHADALERFVREARAASALNHPNIVTIYAIGEADGHHFIAMELVRGRTLRQLGRDGVAGASGRADVGSQAARALAVAHEAGIVHRDIKPENVMVRDDGYVKVLDFGIAQLARTESDRAREDDTRLTRPGMVVGTMRYMSPEQATADEITPASDIFSLGIVLLRARDRTASVRRELRHGCSQLDHSARCPCRRRASIARLPKEFDAVIMRMLSKNAAAAADCDRSRDSPRRDRRAGYAGRRRRAAAASRAKSSGASSRSPHCATSSRGSGGSARRWCASPASPESERRLSSKIFFPSSRGALRISSRADAAPSVSPARKRIFRFSMRSRICCKDDPGGRFEHALERERAFVAASRSRRSTPGRAAPRPPHRRSGSSASSPHSSRTSARDKPLVLFIEDIHWADASTVDLLAYVVTRLGTKQTVHDRHVPAVGASARAASVPCAQARSSDARRRARAAARVPHRERSPRAARARSFPGSAFPPELARLVHSRTEGNPLFVADVAEYLRGEGRDSRERRRAGRSPARFPISSATFPSRCAAWCSEKSAS